MVDIIFTTGENAYPHPSEADSGNALIPRRFKHFFKKSVHTGQALDELARL